MEQKTDHRPLLLLIRPHDFLHAIRAELSEFCDVTHLDVEHVTAIWCNPSFRFTGDPGTLPNVRYVLTNTTDTSHVDAFCGAKGIRPISLQDPSLRDELKDVTATADYAEILVRLALRAVDRDDPPGKEIHRATVGLLVPDANWPGRIARNLADRLIYLGGKMIYLDFENLPQSSGIDCLSVHLPAIPRYQGVLCEDLFRRLPFGVALVNTSRGTLVCERDLLNALETGRIRRYVSDFPGPDHPRILNTNHVAGYEQNAVLQTQRMIVRLFRRRIEESRGLS